MSSIPTKIEPSPLIDVVVELRFDTDLSSSSILAGQLYNALDHRYPSYEELSTMQLPKQVRESADYKYSPHYRLSNEDYSIKVGKNVISIINHCSPDQEYAGWSSYKGVIDEVLRTVESFEMIQSFNRVGVRYVNFFTDNILEKIQASLDVPWEEGKLGPDKLIGLTLVEDDFTTKVQITTNAKLKSDTAKESGDILDLDAYIEKETAFKDIYSKIENGHDQVKNAFFTLLKDEFIATLNPDYE